MLPYEQRNTADAGNLVLSWSVTDDARAMCEGHQFLGVAQDHQGGEVHVFQMAELPAQADQRKAVAGALQALQALLVTISPRTDTERRAYARAVEAFNEAVPDPAARFQPAPAKPTIPEVIPELQQWFRGAGKDSPLFHVMLEDGNNEAVFARMAVADATALGDPLAIEIARKLALMSPTQRGKLAKLRHRYAG